MSGTIKRMHSSSKTFFSWLALIILLVLFINYYDTTVLNQFAIFTSEEDVPEYTGFVNSVLDLIYSYAK